MFRLCRTGDVCEFLVRPHLRVLILLGGLVAGSLNAAEKTQNKSIISASPSGVEFFEKKIRPILAGRCYKCHSEESGKRKGGLYLDRREGWHVGGDTGPAIVPGNVDESLVVEAVRYSNPDFEMPPKGKLSVEEIALLEQWVKMGSPDPRVGGSSLKPAKRGIDVEKGRQFWSFKPVGKSLVPKTKNGKWAFNDIDRFILAGLEQAELKPVANADRADWIRRVYFDLIGLPPTPAQIDAFVTSSDADAYGIVVDDLLASSHFGERWGRHWLDVARFAESSGGGRTLLFPDAWRYRDYVIKAFADDKPYDQFVREQIAGDLLPHQSREEKTEHLTATAYLTLGPTNYERQDKPVLETDVVDEQLDSIGKGLLGLTFGCARCHDHKFDPISTKDYYAMAGILMSTQTMVHSNVSRWVETPLPLPAKEEAKYKKHEILVASLSAQVAALKKDLDKVAPLKPVAIKDLPGIVVDDADAVKVGKWKESTHFKAYVGKGYIHDENSGKGKKTLTFSPKVMQDGWYEVRLSYTHGSSRSNRVPVTIFSKDGERVVYVNQKKAPPVGDRFVSLGRFQFDNNGQWFVMISNEGTSGHVTADAVQLLPQDEMTMAKLPRPDEVDKPELIAFIVPDPSSLPGVVVDNTEAKLVGEWKHSVHTPPFVGVSYLHDDKKGKGEKSATFTPDLPNAGLYEVRLSHNSNVRRATNTPITIKSADGSKTIRINQQDPAEHGKLFKSLGEFVFEAGKKGSVIISTEGTEGKNVIVDAVQFIPRGDAAKTEALLAREIQKQVQDQLKTAQAKLKKAKKNGKKRPLIMSVKDGKEPGDFFINIRGILSNRGPDVPRGFPEVAITKNSPVIPAGYKKSGRLEFAQWLSSAENPLMARVMVNRIWYWVFGKGLVSTLDNFGLTGEKPSHPELLDYLAVDFVENGWSMKHLVREMVLSHTYRLGVSADKGNLAADPENRLLWRMHRRRLDAESIRDAILVTSGQLDQRAGGSSVKKGTTTEYGYKFTSNRRSVYTPVFRNQLLELFEAFDFANPNQVSGGRNTSTIATQALYFMNHPFVIEKSHDAAKRLLAMKDLSEPARIHLAYRETLGRLPGETEQKLASAFVSSSSGTPAQQMERWAQFYQSLFGSLDFRYVN
ncbi:MAG: DUF1553 domain-containing protein [Verrucomicrobiota bacterium]